MPDTFFQPVSGFELPRFAGIATFMRLPHVGLLDKRLNDVQIGLIGTPWDGGAAKAAQDRAMDHANRATIQP